MRTVEITVSIAQLPRQRCPCGYDSGRTDGCLSLRLRIPDNDVYEGDQTVDLVERYERLLAQI